MSYGMMMLKLGSLGLILCSGCVALDSDPAPTAEADPGAMTDPGAAPGAEVIAGKQGAVRPPAMPGATTGDALPPKPHAAQASLSPSGIVWETATASATSAWPTQFITVTATVNEDVGPTPYYIRLYENASPPNILATCSSGTTCSASLTHPGIASTVVVGTVVDAAGNSQLGESPYVALNWHGASPSISVSPTTVAVGATSTVTVTTTADVGPSPFFIEIFDTTTATLVKSCASGTSCVAPVSQAAASTHGYQAFISPSSPTFPPPGSIESTNHVYVTWSNAGFTITLNDRIRCTSSVLPR